MVENRFHEKDVKIKETAKLMEKLCPMVIKGSVHFSYAIAV